MIGALRKKFILAAAEALLAVLLITLLAVNLGNRASQEKTQNERLLYLAENDVGPSLNMLERNPSEGGQGSDELTDFFMSMRYFILVGDDPKDIPSLGLAQLSYVTDEDGTAFMAALLSGGKSFGSSGDFRYYVATNAQDGYKVIFLYCGDDIAGMRSLLSTSLIVGVLCFLAAMMLVVVLSRKVIRPFAENIERQKRFITDASHEIKTPLGIITSDVDMLAMEYGENEWTRSALGQADRLARLVDDLIVLSRLDEEAKPPAPMPFCLTDVVAEELLAMLPVAEEKNVSLRSELAPALVLQGDEGAARKIVSILLDNAVKYVPDGGNAGVALSQGKKSCLLRVENTCDDPQALDLARLFDRFYRGDASRSQKSGYGVGLSIARSAAEHCGWSLTVRAEGEDQIVFCLEMQVSNVK